VSFAVQTRLDRAHCSPGGIDGRWGAKSKKALSAWQEKNKQPITGEWDEGILAALGGTNQVLTTYTVTVADHAALTPYPSTWRGKAQREWLGYVTIEELVAEKFHLYPVALRRMNPTAAWPNPPAGTVLTVASVKTKPLPRLSKIEIRVGERLLRAYGMAGELVAQFPCSVAASKSKRPVGETLKVTVWAENPEYTFDPEMYADNPESVLIGKRLRIPPGPNNPVGAAWIGLDRPGYGIHGTPNPAEISRTESHGCFRLTNWDALKLIHAVYVGLPVTVLP
jgi:lipoprotein-anchoring transpeptidase ErfK/SrfK